MRRTAHTWSLGLLALLVGSLALSAPSAAGTADTEIMRMAFSDVRNNPCIGEFGELVTTTGMLHIVKHTTTNQNGQTDTYSYVYQGMTGTGMLSGVRYIETHVQNQSSYFSTSPPPLEVTDTETLVLNRVAPNGAVTDDDYLLHAAAHMTISASGQVTDKSLEFKPECR
jgi:hypothetical protein